MTDAEFAAALVQKIPYLSKIAWAHTSPTERYMAEDFVQEALLKAHRWRSTLRDGYAINGWLRRILINAIQEYRRRSRTTTVTMAFDPVSYSFHEIAAIRKEENLRFLAAVDCLDTLPHAPFILTYFPQRRLSDADIADVIRSALHIDLSIAAVRFQRAKAIQIIRRKLQTPSFGTKHSWLYQLLNPKKS